MSRKVLFVATVLRMHVLVFHLPYMRWFQEQGYEVHLCCANDTPDPHPQVPYCDRWVELPFSRSPFSADNREVFRRLKQLIDAEDYALIHCNTPVGGLLGRLAARAARKRGTRVVYTAHGFHFFTGAPLKNWLLFYPAERLLSRCAVIAEAYHLSPRESEVFQLIALGKSPASIERELCIAGGTLKSHTQRIYQKLGVHSRDELYALVGERPAGR